MHDSYKQWLDDGQPKVFCKCGCGEEIIITKCHKYNGIPKYIKGHYIRSEKQKKQISIRMLNEGNHFFRKHHSEESKQKIKDNHPDFSGENNPNFENHCSEETKQKIRDNKPDQSGKKNSKFGIPPSPLCSHGKRCYYNSLLQGKICFRSSYELKFAQYLDKNNISWLYEIQTFDLGDTTYTPDFYLPTCDMFIEIKGYMSNYAQEKINKFLNNYNDECLKILYKEDLVKLNIKV